MYLNSSLNHHAHDHITNIISNRDVATSPSDYYSGNGYGSFRNSGLKTISASGVNDGSYVGILGYSAWCDASGNGAHELAFTDYGELYYRFGKSSWGDWYNIVNSGNISRYALPLTGGALSGNLEVGDGTAKDRKVSVRSNTRLISLTADSNANGSDSDAGIYDQLTGWILRNDSNGDTHVRTPSDTANGTQIATTAWTRGRIANGADINKVTIDLTDTSKYNASTYYPVYGSILGMARNYRLTCTAVLYACGAPSWSTHDGGFFATVDILDCGLGWGARTSNMIILDNNYNFVNGEHPIIYKQLTNSSTPVFYVRGGGKYYFNTDYACTWTVVTSTITIREQSIKPEPTTISTTEELNPHAIVLKHVRNIPKFSLSGTTLTITA